MVGRYNKNCQTFSTQNWHKQTAERQTDSPVLREGRRKKGRQMEMSDRLKEQNLKKTVK